MTSPAVVQKAVRVVRRVEGTAIPDGEGTLLERATQWQAVEAVQAEINAWCPIVPALRGPLEQYRMARAQYVPLADRWPAVRDAQLAMNRAAWAWVEAEGEGTAELHFLLVALDRQVAEYRRIGGALDRAPADGAPG